MENDRSNEDYKEKYEIGDIIGKGGYGKVCKAKSKTSNQLFAIKLISMEDEDSEERDKVFKQLIYETNNMKICSNQSRNQYSVKCYEFYKYEDEFVIVMELCDDNLLNTVKKKKEGLKSEEIYQIISQLNETFKIMVKNNIVHRDIKLENILVKYEDKEKQNFIVKLTDYGISKQVTKTTKCHTLIGTDLTMAPEVMEGREFYDNKCDLWNIGVIIYQLAFNKYPYSGITQTALIKNIKENGNKFFKRSKDVDLDNLIRSLLIYEPTKRINWNDYFNHSFFLKYRIKDDYKKFYKIGDKIGKGAYGVVYKAKNINSDELFAIKIIDIDCDNEKAEKQKIGLINELKNMKICSDENKNEYSVKYYEYFKYENEFVFVMELCDDNLLKILKERKKPFDYEEIRQIMSQLNKTFEIMENNKIIHRDIKLENILVKYDNKEKQNFIVKLTDYGVSKQVSSTTIRPTIAGTPLTMAPELLEGRGCNNKYDFWSIGGIIYQLAFNEYPYNGENDLLLYNNIKQSGQRHFKKSNDKNLDDLISRLLEFEPNERINWNDYFNHKFFISVTLKKEDYKQKYEIIGKRIGKGTFGEVFKAKNKNTGELVALKKIYIDESSTEEEINILINELNNMKICTNNNLNENSVKLYEYYQNDDEFIIVMELCDNNLENLLNQKKSFKPKEIYEILTQLNNTFRIMVKNNIVHRDLKLENILIKSENTGNKNYIFKLTDYGVSKQVTLTTFCKTFAGTPRTMAPEILEGDEQYDNKCDLWSIGVIIYQLLFTEYPYKGLTEIAILNDIKRNGIKLLKKSEDNNLNKLIWGLLIKDNRERMTWEEYFNHPFFTGNTSETLTKTVKNIYSKIIIKLKVSKNHKKKYKKIFFLENESFFINCKEIKNEEIFKELNERNTELYINSKKKEFKKYFIPNLEEGEDYIIELIIKNKISNCNSMFRDCNHIISIDLSSFDTSEVKDMSSMFCNCYNLRELKLANLNTGKVENMKKMFQNCNSLEKIDFPPSFTIKNVKDISLMFNDCHSLKNLNLPFDTHNVENMKGLFKRCYNLTKIDLRSFKTDKVKKMTSMFDECTKLEEIIFEKNNFKTTSVDCMGHMFNNCFSVKTLKLSHFNTENVKYMNSMFANCKQLSNIDLSNFSNKSLNNISCMFNGCVNLKTLNLSSFNKGNNECNNIFDNCPKLKNVSCKNENIIQKFKEILNKN